MEGNDAKKNENKNNVKTEESKEVAGKNKFICRRSFESCAKRGPIPITFYDLEKWAADKVIDNFLAHLQIDKNEKGSLELYMVPLKYKNKLLTQAEKEKDKGAGQEDDTAKEEKTTEPDAIRCPMYNIEKKECLVYKYRPLYCKAYPLEFDGKGFAAVDETAPRPGDGLISKEERFEIKNAAELFYKEGKRMRIVVPVMYSVIYRTLYPIMKDTVKQELILEMFMEQQKLMQNMDPKKREEFIKMQQKMAELVGEGKDVKNN